MTLDLLRFEWRYHTRRITFWAAAGLFVLMGTVLGIQGYGADHAAVDSPYAVAQVFGLLSLVAIVPLALFTSGSALRDVEHNMAEIVYATGLSRARYLITRFAGMLLAAGTAYLFGAVGHTVGTLLGQHDPEMVTGFTVASYGWPLLTIVVPNLLLVGALLFSIALLSGSSLAAYIGGVLVFLLYFVCAWLTNSPIMAGVSYPTPEQLALAARVDPLGLTAIIEQNRYYTVDERNTRLLALEGNFLVNRLIWVGVASLLLGTTFRLFRLRLPTRSKNAGSIVTSFPRTGAAPSYRPFVPDATGLRLVLAGLASSIRLELRHTLKNWPFLVLLIWWVFFIGTGIIQGLSMSEYGTSLIPATSLILEQITQPFTVFGIIAVLYFSAELVWRERVAGVAGLIDATPAPNAVFYFSKGLTLILVVGVLGAIAVVLGVGYQVASGYAHIRPGLYASLFYFQGLPLVFFAIASLFIQTVVPNKYVGMFASLILGLVVMQEGIFGLHHNLTRFAGTPPVTFSEMTGLGPASMSAHWFLAYWAAFTFLLAAVTLGAWRRGTQPSLRRRLRQLPYTWGRRGLLAVALLTLLFVTTGGFIYYESTIRHPFRTEQEVLDWKTDYEHRYAFLRDRVQPRIAGVNAHVDLFPETGAFVAKGTLRLVNTSDHAIDTLWVSFPRDLRVVGLTVEGGREVGYDERFATYVFALEAPMVRENETLLRFAVELQPRGVRTGAFYDPVVANGSFLTDDDFMPNLGYDWAKVIRDPATRRKQGLPEAQRYITPEAARRRGEVGQAAPMISFEATVTTSAGQVVVAPGRLTESRREGGREVFHYVSEHPMLNAFGFASARYEKQTRRHGTVEVEVYFHPEHDDNVDRMLEAAVRSLDHFEQTVGRYPFDQLRIVEVPAFAQTGAALALPSTIFYSEDRGFLTAMHDETGFDLITKRIAHEVAHQWWGHQVVPADVMGAATLNETTAKYAELQVLEQRYGLSFIRSFMAAELDRYLSGRAQNRTTEPPLYLATNEAYIFYAKGLLVMHALRDLLGREALEEALARYARTHAYPGPMPTTLDLIDALYAVSAPEQHALIDAWWKKITLYDLRLNEASCSRLPDGRYEVAVAVTGRRTEVSDGHEEAVEMNERLAIGLMHTHPDRVFAPEEIIHQSRHHVTDTTTHVTMVVDEPPAYVVLDPYLTRIERERMDNVQQIDACEAL